MKPALLVILPFKETITLLDKGKNAAPVLCSLALTIINI
jgi:hypothetical protein